MTLAAVREAMGDLRVTPKIPEGRETKIFDDFEEARTDDRGDFSGWATFMKYEDAKGRLTQRRITCRSISGEGGPKHLHGFCHERRAIRSFRIDRIVELVDYRTGEAVEAQRHFEDMRMHGLIGMKDRVLADLAMVLVFMADCDGEYHPLEHSAIEDSLSRYLLRCGGNEAELPTVLKNLPALAPDADDTIEALHRLLSSNACPSISRLILDGSSDVMAADGKFESAEARWSSQLQQILISAAN